jgi:hypothetical protein
MIKPGKSGLHEPDESRTFDKTRLSAQADRLSVGDNEMEDGPMGV